MNQPQKDKSPRIVIYARYSDTNQRETSIEDQIRLSKETAIHKGFDTNNIIIYSDSAISGQAHTFKKREGRKQLEIAWDNNEFDVIILDAFERLARDRLEQAIIINRLSKSRRVRLLTADGIDSHQVGWESALSIKGISSQLEISNLRHRVKRGMEGQLVRGFMVATPPFGYDLTRESTPEGRSIGSHWVINLAEAEIVREIFERRTNGVSMHKIADWLNSSGIPCSRRAMKQDGGYWRPSRIRNLLSNTIYKGEFTWHGSTTYQYRAKARGDEVEEKTFPRPLLRLVSDETWSLCNQKLISRSGYGGGKHEFAGLISCGHCNSTLVLTSKSRCRSIYCANCTVAKACDNQSQRQSVTVAVAGVRVLLLQALTYFLTPEFIAHFRMYLREKLAGDSTREYEAQKKEFQRLKGAQERLSLMIVNSSEDDEVLAARYTEIRQQVKSAERELGQLEEAHAEINQAAIAAQLQIDPAQVLAGIFEAGLPPEKLRAILSRLFPTIVLEGKQGRYASIFKIKFAAGAALALASQTESQINEEVEMRFMLRYKPDNRSGDGDSLRWSVSQLESEKTLIASCNIHQAIPA